jgi:hypothetical protein
MTEAKAKKRKFQEVTEVVTTKIGNEYFFDIRHHPEYKANTIKVYKARGIFPNGKFRKLGHVLWASLGLKDLANAYSDKYGRIIRK